MISDPPEDRGEDRAHLNATSRTDTPSPPSGVPAAAVSVQDPHEVPAGSAIPFVFAHTFTQCLSAFSPVGYELH